jgi:hypothetical protein
MNNCTLISNSDYVGPVYLLAYTLGEEGFKDTNGDGILQENEAFSSHEDDYGNKITDVLFNASSEPLKSPLINNAPDYVDYNGDNKWQAPDEVYQGRACVQPLIDAGNCKDQTIPIWQYTKFTFSGMGNGDSVAQLGMWQDRSVVEWLVLDFTVAQQQGAGVPHVESSTEHGCGWHGEP